MNGNTGCTMRLGRFKWGNKSGFFPPHILQTLATTENHLTLMNTLNRVSKCHLLEGAYLSAARTMALEQCALNSASDRSRNVRSSFIMLRMFCPLMSANESSMARRRIDTSGSLKKNTICTVTNVRTPDLPNFMQIRLLLRKFRSNKNMCLNPYNTISPKLPDIFVRFTHSTGKHNQIKFLHSE